MEMAGYESDLEVHGRYYSDADSGPDDSVTYDGTPYVCFTCRAACRQGFETSPPSPAIPAH